MRSSADGTTNGLINVPNFLGDGALRVALPPLGPLVLPVATAAARTIPPSVYGTIRKYREDRFLPMATMPKTFDSSRILHILRFFLGVRATVVGLCRDKYIFHMPKIYCASLGFPNNDIASSFLSRGRRCTTPVQCDCCRRCRWPLPMCATDSPIRQYPSHRARIRGLPSLSSTNASD